MSIKEPFINLGEAERRLESYHYQLRQLIEQEQIPIHKVGNAILLDAESFARLAKAVRDFRNRRGLTGRPRKSARAQASS